MIILGISGSLDPAHPSSDPVSDYRMVDSSFVYHDAAAVLVRYGKVVAGIEEERLNRIKHANKFPARAMRFCLESQGLSIEDVDHVAFYSQERIFDLGLAL